MAVFEPGRSRSDPNRRVSDLLEWKHELEIELQKLREDNIRLAVKSNQQRAVLLDWGLQLISHGLRTHNALREALGSDPLPEDFEFKDGGSPNVQKDYSV